MRTNDQVTGFDIIHLRYDQHSDKLELWLGEAKIHKNFSAAISSAVDSLRAHIDAGFLEETKALVGPKISKSDPLYEKLFWIFDNNVAIDEIFDRMVVPVLIASDCRHTGEVGTLPENYVADAKARLAQLQKRLNEEYGKSLQIIAIYFPLNNKDGLEKEFSSRLEALT
jgi:hypothetical protein